MGRREILRKTFIDEFEPVEGMSPLYQSWRKQGHCLFHYVSNSPWQLLPLLHRFLHETAFPHHTLHLRSFSMSGKYDPILHKKSVIERLIKEFPERRWVFVGDSGESDLEM